MINTLSFFSAESLRHFLTLFCLLVLFINEISADEQPFSMPSRGACAHRGASTTHPENTLPAFEEAVRLGVAMIEFDVALTKDGQLVLMHDHTIDRTTDASGKVSDWTLADLKELDAGSWKAKSFQKTRIPTLDEALSMMPVNIWLNVHLKGGTELAEKTARTIAGHNRLHQAFLACNQASARAAQKVEPEILICNMERQSNSRDYVLDTIKMDGDFIQLLGGQGVNPEDTELLKSNGVRINYYGTNDPQKFRELMEDGVEFPLTDDPAKMMPVVRDLGIEPVKPVYRANVPLPDVEKSYSRLLEQRPLPSGRANQGLALTADACYASTATHIYQFNTKWELQQEKRIQIEGVNHVGAIDVHNGFIWAGLLHGPEGGKHDPKKNRSIIAKIDARDLSVVKTWDITNDVTWIDPVCFDGQSLYVGDLSDLGIHRYEIQGDKLVRTGILRYPRALHFSQGIRVRDGKLYSIHTFGEADGLFEFALPEEWTEEIQQPTRAWKILEPVMHCEGFDFVPGHDDQIWHAQHKQVDRYRLLGMKE